MQTKTQFTPLIIPPELLPQRLPQHWRDVTPRSDPFSRWYRGPKGLAVMFSLNVEEDGHRWLHASISHQKRIPTYDELRLLKRVWIGDALDAYLILPRSSRHINIHPNCLHLYACLDAEPTPDFTHGLGII